MEQLKSTLDQDNMEFNYKKIKENVYNLKLPNQRWTTIKDPSGKIMFLRIEEDYRSYLAVSINSELDMKVYYRSKVLKWIKCDKPQKEEDIENVLQMIDRIIYSEIMFFLIQVDNKEN
ncbi:uncharacterized protein LOC122503065 [Leptopilina heterotoma]|uniref:uncharacterized protein LOC122503065 n=1 Tax=Leptopilina heterotoma TaxID=63436 RepID=UPI001CA8C9A0|nr:uncharacterized protein LOC122503065 [Leptopilina heterotoma]